ncbi:MAG: HAMP domain-containing histidine kinase [Clostridia bacterium]|nr:HAMP domain-containing histidine kinase [Clostridia bacterium]
MTKQSVSPSGQSRRKTFRLIKFRWLFLVDTIIVIAATMIYGLLAFFFLGLTEKTALSMVAVLPLMAMAAGFCTWIILRLMRRRMGALLDGIQAVAGGNLDVHVECKNEEEYKPVFDGFNKMTAELKKNKGEMENFINSFSHEFRTPIASIAGFAHYLAETGEGTESEERMEYLNVIEDESMRLSSLAQNALLLSKVEACEIISGKTEYDLSEQVKRCIILQLPRMEEKGIQLDVDLGEIIYSGNEELMEHVWINLLNNSIKFTPSGGEISVLGKEADGTVTLEFKDTGIGMDEETKRHVFEKYYQHDSISAVQGNGIGLAIADRIVKLCGGEIRVESAPGKGSCFTVILPV